ncbi:hypothetical protein ACIBCL_23180 [Micromonospora zamorensis]|uniref:hypothetical protein n=1 Tax=Micromonospora zamorensis TaxID=709883 RepID=UPI0037A6AD6F
MPNALQPYLREWIYDSSEVPYDVADRVIIRLHLRYRVEEPDDLAEVEEIQQDANADTEDPKRLFLAYGTSAKRLLDIIDALLDLIPQRTPVPTGTDAFSRWQAVAARMTRDPRDSMRQYLSDARSIYRISEDERALTRRTDPMAKMAYTGAMGAATDKINAGSSAEHLRKAWESVHALHPDAPWAYSEAIKAVEAAAHAVIQPRHGRATLGTMLGELRNVPAKFSLAISGPDGRGDVGPLIHMLQLLWSGQTSRHGSQSPTRPETLTEAVMAVHLATTLVQWFTTGCVRSAQ